MLPIDWTSDCVSLDNNFRVGPNQGQLKNRYLKEQEL